MYFKFVNIYLFVECWQDDLESRPDIQDVEQTLRKMISGSNARSSIKTQEWIDNVIEIYYSQQSQTI